MVDDFVADYVTHEKGFPEPRAPALIHRSQSRPARPQPAPIPPACVPGAGDLPQFRLITADQLAAWPSIEWRVGGVIPKAGVGIIAGQPSCGKSFLALNLAGSLSSSSDWFGHKVKPCKAFYVALEGSGGLAQRVRAHRDRYNDMRGVKFVVDSSFRLYFEDDVDALAEEISSAGGSESLIIVDTLSRAAVGLDENSSQDMGRLVAGMARLSDAINGCVIAVHHLGKDSQRGLRGHSSLLGAADFVIEVTRDGSAREWRLAKAKDGVDGDAHPFRLDVVGLGEDEHGEEITSCVVSPAEQADSVVKRVRIPQGGNQLIVWNALGELLRSSQDFGKAGAPAPRPCIELEPAIIQIRDRLATEPKRKTERTRQAITGLVASGLIQVNEGWLWST